MFGFGKKKEKKETSCCGNCTSESMEKAEKIKANNGVKILGGGCAKCHELEANTKAALSELGLNEDVALITDFSVIAAYGVMTTPALVIDNKVVACGKVLKTSDVMELIRKVRDKQEKE